MNCRAAQKQIFAARDGVLEDIQRAALASHLEACAVCRQVERGLGDFVDAWREEIENQRTPDPALEWRKLQRRIAEPNAQPRRNRSWLAIPALALAAAAIAIGVYVEPNRPAPQAISPAATVAVATPPASSSPVALQPAAVVFVDDKSGWTFVWDDSGQKI